MVFSDLIDYGDGKGFTALMHSVFAKSARCGELFLECGSKPELKDGKGRTALHFCSRQVRFMGFTVKKNQSDSVLQKQIDLQPNLIQPTCMVY